MTFYCVWVLLSWSSIAASTHLSTLQICTYLWYFGFTIEWTMVYNKARSILEKILRVLAKYDVGWRLSRFGVRSWQENIERDACWEIMDTSHIGQSIAVPRGRCIILSMSWEQQCCINSGDQVIIPIFFPFSVDESHIRWDSWGSLGSAKVGASKPTLRE